MMNRIKVVLDCLQGYLYADDKQVQKIIAERFEDKKSPRLEIWVLRENADCGTEEGKTSE